MNNSMERIVPLQLSEAELGYETMNLHLERYKYAGKFVLPGALMDVACGVGYGSFFLAENHSALLESIIAVDIDEASIKHAKQNYAHPRITFAVADALTVRVSDRVKTVVSLETLEHLSHPQLFIENVSVQLQRGARFIVSVPITPSMDANPFHLHDFTKKEFVKAFIDSGFRQVDSLIQTQKFDLVKVMSKNKTRPKEYLRKSILLYYWKNPGKLLLRISSTLRFGFTNRYYVGVFEKL